MDEDITEGFPHWACFEHSIRNIHKPNILNVISGDGTSSNTASGMVIQSVLDNEFMKHPMGGVPIV